MDKKIITLAHGSGGTEMAELIKSFSLTERGNWDNFDNDSATLSIGSNEVLVYTTDSYVIDPIFFPGGDIGHLAVCGTINDLAVMGAKPIGLSLALVIEEGFLKEDLEKIISSIDRVSNETGIPLATGDTKVMDRGKIDKIIINTSGIGIAKKEELLTKSIKSGDKVILSGGLGEHAVALLSKRFDYETSIISDTKSLLSEIESVKEQIKIARDVTRGGLASVLNELCGKHKVRMEIDEQSIPAKNEVRKVVEMLGIDLYQLACEGKFICIASSKDATAVEKKLQSFNKDAKIIGEITKGDKVIVQTIIGKRIMPHPTGTIVPRIC
ncbi:MAG: hydrogenase expression/formation protein HypE [Candidatus Altiarchaeota archaeon]